MTRAIWLGVGVLAWAAQAAPARACEPPGLIPHTVDAEAINRDVAEPVVAPAPMVIVKRGQGPVRGPGGTSSSTSCDDIGNVRIFVKASDDVAKPLEIGYRLRLTTGSLPEAFALPPPEEAVRIPIGDAIMLTWIDGATDEQEPIAFTLSITPVDTAGKTGAPITVGISDPGIHSGSRKPGGCAYAGRASPGVGFLLLVVLLLRRRRT